MKIKANNDIILYRIREKNAPVIFSCIDESRDFLRKWLPWVDETRQEEDTVKYIRRVVYSRAPGKELVFEIWHMGSFAGLIGLTRVDPVNNKAEMGYWLGLNAVGKGIMIRSCMALIDHAFDKLQLNKLQIRCASENTPSCNIPKQLGFTFEGIERQGELLHGRYMDLKVYSLLKKEWLRLQGPPVKKDKKSKKMPV